ncbi:MAG: hypothetical protein JW878_04265 [Methanomicrobia archaeon]|nr:hypothetical protein [Methanomicrobia archaeon]
MMHKSGQDAFIGLCLVCLLLVAITAVAHATTAEDEQLAEIQNAIEEKGARWTAGKTAVSGLSTEEKELLFGLKIDSLPADIPVISPPTRLRAIPYGTFDWRNKDGQNWITSVKNQGSCGSCWAFAALGAVEAVINIERNDPDIDIDLSEQHLVSDCCTYCGNCGGGSPWNALYYIEDNGVPDEACFSYQASNSSCSPCSDWPDRAWTIENAYWITSPLEERTEAYKWGLETYGPMIVVLHATSDFLYYTGGIYEPVLTEDWGAVPNHAVVLVGYNDTEQYWIIKNSWGVYSGWGEEGYVKVNYGVLEQYDYALVVDNTVGPAPSAPVVSSPTHPIESAWYCSGNVTFTWTTPSDPSGIACYSYTLDQSPTTTPDETCDTTGNSKSYANLSDGTRYFHVRAKDNDGNWGSAGHYRVMIESCDALDGWCCNGDVKELRDYYCSGGNCTYTVTESENCSASDEWIETGSIRWVDDTVCTEKEQQEQDYHDYSCVEGNCSFTVTGTRWIETGATRAKPDGSNCGCTANNTLMKCYNGTCSDTGLCNATICQANAACDGKVPREVCGTGSICNYNCECQEGSKAIFDTEQKVTPYPSISGTYTGVIRPRETLVVSTLYTYPCPGTGGHTEYARIWNSSWKGAEAHWEGYVDDWHTISFNKTFTLLEGETYYYIIRTGSYPQMYHSDALQTPTGWINCTMFIDSNGNAYNDRVPAIRLA